VAYGYDILQLCFEDAVEVLGGSNGDEGVGVGEGGEDTDSRQVVSISGCEA